MLIALNIFGGVLLLMGMAVCIINFAIVLHSLRTAKHMSMVPFTGSIFMLFGLALLGQGEWLAWDFCGIVLPFLFLDLSALPTLLTLPVALLLRAIRGADAPPLFPATMWRVLIISYGAVAGVFALWSFILAAGSAS